MADCLPALNECDVGRPIKVLKLDNHSLLWCGNDEHVIIWKENVDKTSSFLILINFLIKNYNSGYLWINCMYKLLIFTYFSLTFNSPDRRLPPGLERLWCWKPDKGNKAWLSFFVMVWIWWTRYNMKRQCRQNFELFNSDQLPNYKLQ